MKKLSTYLFLIFFSFSTPSYADDIQDLQIEGISIGDSLLDYFSKTQIENFLNYDNLPSSMKFRISEIFSNEFDFDLYNGMQVFYKPEDENFKIHGILGYITCFKKSECEKIFNDMSSDLSEFFKDSKKSGGDKNKHPDDKSGRSTTISYYFELTNGKIIIEYIDWSSNVEWQDNVRVGVNTIEVVEWIKNGYF